jgi:hypothetical protein
MLLSIALCELCRVLERTYAGASSGVVAAPAGQGLQDWWWAVCGIGSGGGSGGGAHGTTSPLLALADALEYASSGGVSATGHWGDSTGKRVRAEMVRERLARDCGDHFCACAASFPASSLESPPPLGSSSSFSSSSSRRPRAGSSRTSSHDTGSTSTPESGPGGEREREREIGLLHCGDGTGGGCFLVLDFSQCSLRLVDCRLADMKPNAAEPRKFDLTVSRARARAGRGNDGEKDDDDDEEGELMRVAAARREASAFWLRYAMADE